MKDAGYTLIELLVVMAIIGIVVALVAPATVATVDGARLRADTRSVVTALRSLQTAAGLERKDTVVTADPGGSLLMAGDVVDLANGSKASIAGPSGKIVFFADGTASGGQLRLDLGDRRTEIGVAWLTGKITVGDAP